MARVDHYVGYPVTAMAVPNKNAKWKFQLLLEGGTAIRFYDSEAPKESEVAGKGKFIMAVTNHADGGVDVLIGQNTDPRVAPERTATINSKQGSYSVIKEDEPDIEWFPTQVDGPATIPPHNPARVQEAPTEEWALRQQELQDAEDAAFAQEVHEPLLDPEEAENG